MGRQDSTREFGNDAARRNPIWGNLQSLSLPRGVHCVSKRRQIWCQLTISLENDNLEEQFWSPAEWRLVNSNARYIQLAKDIPTYGKGDILPEARWALALGKLSQKLLPVLPALPTSHYIWVPCWADFFLANLMLFLAAVFHNKFQVRKKKKKTQRGNLLLPTARERFSVVKNFYQSVRVFVQLLVVPRWSVHSPGSLRSSLNSVMEWQTRQSNYWMMRNRIRQTFVNGVQ